MSFTPYPALGGQLALQATTGPFGSGLINGTPIIVTWTAPADGANHRFVFIGTRNVGSLETGGQITLAYSPPGGGTISTVVAAGGSGAGQGSLGNAATITGTLASGATVQLQQTSALTGGSCTVFAEIWGS